MRLLFIVLMAISHHAFSLVVLQYHHVDASTPSITSVTPEQFAQHMALLEEEKMVVVDLEDVTHAILNGETIPDRAVAITFDDAYQSIYEHAFPVLRKKHWPFTVFVSTAAVDREFPDMMTWEQLRDLYSEGAVIANHTQDHPYLINTPKDTEKEIFWQEQIIDAEKRLLEEIGESPKIFAYPYGEYTIPMAEWLEDQGFIAFGQQSGAIGQNSHPQVLPRFPASGAYANLDTLRTKLNSRSFGIGRDEVVDPVIKKRIPKLTLRIPIEDFDPDTLQCYAAGLGEMDISPKSRRGKVTVVLKQEKQIESGRGRYNCTAPSLRDPKRFYWYSQLWINTDVENR